MRITKRRLVQIIAEEVEALEYELADEKADLALAADLAADVEAEIDAWSNGTLQKSIDHLDAFGSEELNVRGQEVLKITEAQLRRIIRSEKRNVMLEQKNGGKMHRTFGGEMVPFGSPECIDDICMRMDDATDIRNTCGARTDKRDYYNGVLKVLRRDLRDAKKAHSEIYGIEHGIVPELPE